MRTLSAIFALLVCGTASSAVVTYEFSWAGGQSETGTNQWFMDGWFTIDSSSLNSGVIDETAVLGFYAIATETVTDSTVWEFDGKPAVFRFAFDSDTESFQASDTGLPLWNWWAQGYVGAFQAGSAWELLYEPINGERDPVIIDDARNPGAQASLTAVRVSNVPVPAAVWLFASALGVIGWRRRAA